MKILKPLFWIFLVGLIVGIFYPSINGIGGSVLTINVEVLDATTRKAIPEATVTLVSIPQRYDAYPNIVKAQTNTAERRSYEKCSERPLTREQVFMSGNPTFCVMRQAICPSRFLCPQMGGFASESCCSTNSDRTYRFWRSWRMCPTEVDKQWLRRHLRPDVR